MSTNIPISVMSFPTRMVVGPGALARLPDEVRNLKAERVLIVADRGLQAAGIVARVEKTLQAAGLASAAYLGVSKNPKEQDVLDGVETFRHVEADLIVGLGGGAPMDVAKAIALKATHDQPLATYDDLKDGWKNIHATMPPVIAIPTTAGTGSEVGRSSVICLGEDGHKVVIFSPHLMPKVALLDAELTLGLPGPITAATGMDALTHALEAYVALNVHPFADMCALSALARVGQYLVPAVKNGQDIRARHEMLLAASLGAISFQKNLGGCHALAHPLSAVADLHHGLANSILLPHIIRYNLQTVASRYAVAGEALGAKAVGSDEARAHACLERIQGFVAATGLTDRLSVAGVRPEHIDIMVPQALADPCAPGNPRPLTAETVKELYEAAM